MSTFFKGQLKSQLGGIKAQINTPDILSGLDEAQRGFASLNTSVVGSVVGQVNNGVKSLSSITGDFPIADVSTKLKIELKNATTVPQNLQSAMGNLQNAPAELTESLSGVGDKVKKELSSSENDIANSLTGTTVAPTFNNICVALPTAAGIAAGMAALSPEITSNDIKGTIESAVSDFNPALKAELPQIDDFLSGSINLKIDADLSKLTDGITSGIGNVLGSITGLPILDTLHKMNNSVSQISTGFNLPANSFSKNVAADVLTAFSNNDFTGAFDAIKDQAIGLTFSEIEDKLGGFQNALGSVASMLNSSPTANGAIVSTNPISTMGNTTVPETTINSLEEFTVELASNSRAVDKVVFYWTAATLNPDYRLKDRLDYKEGLGYPRDPEWHYYIWGDGTIERGIPIGKPGPDPDITSPNSIDIIVAGGSFDDGVTYTQDAVTPQTKESTKRLIATIYNVYPGIKMINAAEYPDYEGWEEANLLAPGFDLDTFIENKLGKSNVKQPVIQKPATNKDLGLPTGGGVKYGNKNAGNPRPLNIQPQLMAILEGAHRATGFTMVITSGGQLPGQGTGSVRHNYGWAADLRVFDANGNRVNFGVNNPPPDVLNFARYLASQGITGMGAGPTYMGGNLHVDMAWGRNPGTSSSRRWADAKKGGTDRAAQWLKDVMRYRDNT
jgi:hypothetical protein